MFPRRKMSKITKRLGRLSSLIAAIPDNFWNRSDYLDHSEENDSAEEDPWLTSNMVENAPCDNNLEIDNSLPTQPSNLVPNRTGEVHRNTSRDIDNVDDPAYIGSETNHSEDVLDDEREIELLEHDIDFAVRGFNQVDRVGDETKPSDAVMYIGRDQWDEESFHEKNEDPNGMDFASENIQAYIENDNFDIPDFDPDARQTIGDIGSTEEFHSKAAEKAAGIVGIIGVKTVGERNDATRFLAEFFEQSSHPATFRAIQRIAAGGLDFEVLRSTISLRLFWMQRSEWWLGRYGYGYEINKIPNGASALTWANALRVCLARQDYPVEMMIDDAWRDEWYALPRDVPGYFSFATYVAERIDSRFVDFLGRRLSGHPTEDGGEIADRFDWLRYASDRDSVIRDNFRPVTPS